jgi:hypothetical protein
MAGINHKGMFGKKLQKCAKFLAGKWSNFRTQINPHYLVCKKRYDQYRVMCTAKYTL